MLEFNTLYVFGSNEIQLVGKDTNIIKPFSSVPSIISLILNIYQQKPSDLNIPNQYSTIIVVNGYYGEYTPSDKTNPMFRIKYLNIDESTLTDVINEMKS
jgi:hypothetical protein